jgi:hypothetical protein
VYTSMCDGFARCMVRLYLKFAQTLKPAKSQFTKIWDKSVLNLVIADTVFTVCILYLEHRDCIGCDDDTMVDAIRTRTDR